MNGLTAQDIRRQYYARKHGLELPAEEVGANYYLPPPSNIDRQYGYISQEYGANIEEEHIFQSELHEIVDDMKARIVGESKILEGTLNPEYGKGEWGMPTIPASAGEYIPKNVVPCMKRTINNRWSECNCSEYCRGYNKKYY